MKQRDKLSQKPNKQVKIQNSDMMEQVLDSEKNIANGKIKKLNI